MQAPRQKSSLPSKLPSPCSVHHLSPLSATLLVGRLPFSRWHLLPPEFPVDSKLRGLVTHVNNREDWIPIVPGMLGVGFHHPSGEIHIQDSGAWIACPGAFPFFLHLRVARSIRLCLTFAQPYSGQDNPSHLCIVGDVGNILNGNLSYHTMGRTRIFLWAVDMASWRWIRSTCQGREKKNKSCLLGSLYPQARFS